MPPFAPVLMESTRAMGYSLESAIADIIDNSIAADAKNVEIQFSPYDAVPFISILDDGFGMSKEQINDALSEIEFNKTSCVVNVSSHNIFTESIIVPKLNATEEHKACILKLQKSYKDDFEKQYFYTKTTINLNKNNRRIDFLLLNKSKYKTIINKINLLGLNVDKIVFNPATIGSFIAKKHIFSLDKVGLSVIINKSSVTLLVTKGNHLIDYITHAFTIKHSETLRINNFTLVIHYLVIIKQILTDCIMIAFYLLLCTLNCLSKHIVLNRLILIYRKRVKYLQQSL